MAKSAKVGDPPHIIRGELMKRKLTMRDIAKNYGCSYTMVLKLLSGYTTSAPLSDFINRILAQPVATN